MKLQTIDAHVGGQPLRLVVGGFPAPQGRSMLDKREWLRRHADRLRRALILEPRGHTDMVGALLTEPVSPGSHAGVLFMDNDGYSAMSGHGIIAVTTIALERGLVMPGGDGSIVVYDTPAGTVRAAARRSASRRDGSRAPEREATEPSASGGGAPREIDECRDARIESVAFLNVPSFVLHAGLPLKVGARHLRADVAFGGAFYAIVDSEAAGVGVDASHLPDLRRVGMEIRQAVERAETVVHPLEPRLRGIEGTIFTGPPGGRADVRSVTVFADRAADRSPGGAGTAAIMAVLDAMGLISDDTPFVHESATGQSFSARVTGRTAVGERDAIVAEIEGSAWITGDHTFAIDDGDPLREGFLLA